MENCSLVSVIIPVYNCERYLSEAIESVLSQAYNFIEIIIIDDGSTDGSAQVAKRFGGRVRYFFQANGGIAAARNRGVELAQGSFLAFLDADDVWIENKIAMQMEAFAGDNTLDAVFGHVVQFVSPDLERVKREKLFCPTEPIAGYVAYAMVIKRESFLRVGMFSTDWQFAEFIDWYAKAVEKRLKSHMLPDIVARRRLHGNNTTIRERSSQGDYVRALKSSLDRRRAKIIEERRTAADNANDV